MWFICKLCDSIILCSDDESDIDYITTIVCTHMYEFHGIDKSKCKDAVRDCIKILGD